MSKRPLFSTYRQGENRVTSSMLAVFERIDLSLLETLLGAASGEASLQMVTFTNQPPGQGHSVPDGCISARFAYWFEVKTTRNAVRADQLVEHLHSLEKGAATSGYSAQDQRIGRLINALLTDSPREPGEHLQVFLLTAHDEEGTEILTAPIVNDTRAASGRTWAWTMGQRYVSLNKLTASATVTSELG